MSDTRQAATRRARRLVRWYPRGWRARYGDEFTELLIDDIAERRRSLRRTMDVIRGGVAARLGVAGHARRDEGGARASAGLATLGCAVVVFLLFGLTVWSQLTVGWQWSQPTDHGTIAAVVLLSALMAVFAALGVLSLAPVVWVVVARLARGPVRDIAGPLALSAAGAAVMVVGARHFAHGWPGTGGHPWAQRHLVPHDAAALAWASTLSITSYWVHPSALLAFPRLELAWMVASPLAIAAMIVGGSRVVRRVELSPRALRFEAALGRAAYAAMGAFAVGTACWLLVGGSGPRGLYHAGMIDLVAVGVMIVTLAVARSASRQLGETLGSSAG